MVALSAMALGEACGAEVAAAKSLQKKGVKNVLCTLGPGTRLKSSPSRHYDE